MSALATKTSTAVFEQQYERLNQAQRQAVDAIEGVVMVLAGPGTGKTQILAMRIANILRQTQMDPYNILCLTFTESGVAAMRKRLISIIGPAAYYVRITTFHSFCNDVIQEYPEKFTFARELEVLSEIERIELFQEILNALPAQNPLKPFGNPYMFLPDLAKNVQQLKQEHITTEAYGKLLEATSSLVAEWQPLFTSFWEYSPAQRSASIISQLNDDLQASREKHPMLAMHFKQLEYLYQRYQAAGAVAENKREHSKVATKYKNDVKRFFDQLVNRLPKQQAMKQVYEAYQVKLRERGRYDYEDMLLFVVDRFKRDDELLARYQEQFQYILVDEYQDTNGAQNETVQLLGQFHDNPNIFVVGDDKQSIYRFQGASLENLLFLHQRYQGAAQVIVLEDNYRSQQLILDAAQALIDHNEESVHKYLPKAQAALQAVQEYPVQPIAVLRFDTEETETFGVARRVQALLEQGVAPQEIAVLYRRNADADDLAEVMLKLDIPIQVESGHDILDDLAIRQLVSLLTYVAQPTRHDMLWQLLNFAFWQLDALDVVRAQSYAAVHNVALFTVLSSEEQLTAAGVKGRQALLELAQKLAAWQVLLANRPLQDFVVHVVQESGLLAHVLRQAEHLDQLNCLTTFFQEIKLLNRRHRTMTLLEFLNHLELLRANNLALPAARLQTKRNAVRLMTAHRAKGLEFEHVFIVRAKNHHWGNLRERSMVPLPAGLLRFDPVIGQANNEDERRLFYVALTRAKRTVAISYAAHTASGRETVPTLFLEEIPPEHKQVVEVAEETTDTLRRLQTVAVLPLPAQTNDRLKAFLKTRLENYVLSVTHLNNYVECPRLFYYRNLLRVPSVKSKHMAFGSAIHAALYEFGIAATPQALPASQLLLDSFARHLKKEVLTPAEEKDALELGAALLTNYYQEYQATWCRHCLFEYNFSSHGVTVAGIPLTGMIDKVEILDPVARLVNVVDYKTGNPDTKKKALQRGGEYHRQLVFYKLLCDGSPRFNYTMQSGEIDFVQRSAQQNEYVKKQYTITSKDTQELTGIIKKAWEDIHNLKFLEADNGDFCGECEYCQLAEQGQLAY